MRLLRICDHVRGGASEEQLVALARDWAKCQRGKAKWPYRDLLNDLADALESHIVAEELQSRGEVRKRHRGRRIVTPLSSFEA